MELKPIAEQVVVVVGASSGIGRATALAFAHRGAKVVASARGETGLRSLVEEIRSTGGEATYLTADVNDFEQVEAVGAHAEQTYGRVDTWVGLAAVSLYATFEQTTPEEFKRVVDTNLTGAAYNAMVALPHLRRAGGGALILVSSVEARRALPLQAAYAASKHGIKGFVDALRVELLSEGAPVSVTEVMPSGINTPFFNRARTKIGVKPMPIQPVYQPETVAHAILHAAETPTAEIIVGGGGKAFAVTEKIAPRLLDVALTRFGFDGQRTSEPKSEDAPDNLFQTLDNDDRIHGDFSEVALQRSAYTWLATHPRATGAIAATALGAAAALLLTRGGGRGDGGRQSSRESAPRRRRLAR